MADLSERKKKILASVIELYTKTGEPVGSKGLIAATGMNCSSATVRNEMNELVSMGYLEQPHTSAGRIPTQTGYRYYVDNLMVNREIDELTKRIIDSGLSSSVGDPEKLIEKSGQLLAEITKCACISTGPSGDINLIRRIELVPVGHHTAMMVLLTSNGILKSRLCRLDSEMSVEVLEKFYNIVQNFFIDKPAADIDTASVQTVAASVDVDYFTMLPLMAAVSELAVSTKDSKPVLGGSSNILNTVDYSGYGAALLDFLSRKEPVSEIIKSAKGSLDIKIGTENEFKQLEKSSVIVSKYAVNGNRNNTGAVSVVGPVRMDYENIIPSVRYMSSVLGTLITQALEE